MRASSLFVISSFGLSFFSSLNLPVVFVFAQNSTTTLPTTPPASNSSPPSTTSPAKAPCQDNPSSNCANMKPYCNTPAYRDLLEKNCPVTCNFCGANSCHDETDKCAAWSKNGFCTNPFYKDDVDKYCKKTCGLC